MGKVKTAGGGKSDEMGSEASEATTRSNPKRGAKKPERLEYDPDTHITGVARWKKFKVRYGVVICFIIRLFIKLYFFRKRKW